MVRWFKLIAEAIGYMLVIALIFGSSILWAKCITNDTMRGWDKKAHFAGGAVIATVATMHTGDPWKGFWVGTAVGVAKEALDATGVGTCSLQDALATTAGAALGAWTGGLIVTRVQGRTVVAYATEF